MKIRTFKTFIQMAILFVILLTAAVHGIAAPPEPLVPRKNAGKYYVDLEEMRLALESKKTVEFYQAAYSLMFDLRDNAAETLRGGKHYSTNEGFAAWDWWIYYVVQARLYTEAEYYAVPYNSRMFDITIHGIAAGTLSRFRLTSNDSVGINSPKFKKIYLTYLQSLMEFFHNSEIEINKIDDRMRKEFVEFKTHLQAEFEKNKHRYDFDSQEEFAMDSKLRMKEGAIISMYDRVIRCRTEFSSVSDKYVATLVDVYQGDSAKILESLAKAGYTTKEEQRDKLLRTVGKDKKTEYLYRTLPPIKEKPKPTIEKKK